VTYEAFFKIPTAYLICSEDKALPPVYQEAMVKYAKPDMVERIKSGHSPFISQPNVVADFLMRAAGSKQ
jgi:pimeloyl-ACP methyl ester carboxylesterase